MSLDEVYSHPTNTHTEDVESNIAFWEIAYKNFDYIALGPVK